jgi:hypothetical protein
VILGTGEKIRMNHFVTHKLTVWQTTTNNNEAFSSNQIGLGKGHASKAK